MPRDMAVHQPHARIIRGEGQKQVATGRQYSRIPTRGVVEIEARGTAVPDAVSAADDVEVVAVEVDGVGQLDCGFGLDPPKIPAVGRHFMDVRVIWKVCGSRENGFESRIVPVDDVRAAVNEPAEQVVLVGILEVGEV